MTFAGSPERVEAQLVPEAGFDFDPFLVRGIPREPSVRTLRALVLAARAPVAAHGILGRRKPDVVFGGGGFVAGPMVLAAAARRIPAALSEADAHLGLANRLALPFAKRVFLAYAIEGLEPPKHVVVGRPIPARSRATGRDEARRELGLPAAGPVLGVFGALAGARSLNELVVEAFGAVGPAVLHVTGERDYRSVRSRVTRDDYVVLPSTDRFGAALSAVDLVLGRAGGSVWEVAAAGKPAVLVPYPHATADHQTKNAIHFQRAGGAIVVQESELGTVPAIVRSLLGDSGRLAGMADAMARAAKPDAAREIADGLVELARR